MSVLTRNRILFLACALLLPTQALLASNPSARTHARMVYDASRTHFILFGGATTLDTGTGVSYDLNDTWEWVGDHWVERFPAHVPPGRSGHTVVYDSTHKRTLMFGGKHAKDQLNDTWAFDGEDWTQLTPPNSPTGRFVTSAAYDPIRDRMVLFGGMQSNTDGKTTSFLYDTWEFDGTTWVQTATTGPEVIKPALVYDAGRNQVLMIAMDVLEGSHMFSYDAAAAKWNEIKPAHLPTCVNDSAVVYQAHTGNVILFGGSCSAATVTSSETWSWNGEDWTKLTPATSLLLLSGAALAYDTRTGSILAYGGVYGTTTLSTTYSYKDDDWTAITEAPTPAPRSLAAFVSDAFNQDIWMYGGLNENGWLNDFWRYHSGQWERKDVVGNGGPITCDAPLGAWDTDKNKLVLVCEDSTTWEFDNTNWKKFQPSTTPVIRRYGAMVYDPVQKKMVMFGGYNDINGYVDETWLWDGTNWSRQKKNPAPSRALQSMWFDPVQKKVLLYGGIGRKDWNGRLERFSDMWSFDASNGWSEIKNVTTPGSRYGAQTAVDPSANRVVLFGGLRLDVNGVVQTQVFTDDMWQWNGQSWTKMQPASVPQARENGALAYDPSANALTMFGGYNGRWLGDLWTFDAAKASWTPLAEEVQLPSQPVVTPPRRRVIR